jgi:hypothetical protein
MAHEKPDTIAIDGRTYFSGNRSLFPPAPAINLRTYGPDDPRNPLLAPLDERLAAVEADFKAHEALRARIEEELEAIANSLHLLEGERCGLVAARSAVRGVIGSRYTVVQVVD